MIKRIAWYLYDNQIALILIVLGVAVYSGVWGLALVLKLNITKVSPMAGFMFTFVIVTIIGIVGGYQLVWIVIRDTPRALEIVKVDLMKKLHDLCRRYESRELDHESVRSAITTYKGFRNTKYLWGDEEVKVMLRKLDCPE